MLPSFARHRIIGWDAIIRDLKTLRFGGFLFDGHLLEPLVAYSLNRKTLVSLS